MPLLRVPEGTSRWRWPPSRRPCYTDVLSTKPAVSATHRCRCPEAVRSTCAPKAKAIIKKAVSEQTCVMCTLRRPLTVDPLRSLRWI